MTAVVLRGDAAHLPLPDASVDLLLCSPPYFGLRAYSDDGEVYAGQIGSEASPREYLGALAACTREWVRVLKPSGSIFVNLGDKYATRYSSLRGGGRAGLNGDDGTRGRSGQNHTGAGEKSLLGLPWRYALACMDDLGLILRRDIIWHKPNGLPESVTDRCRSSHEYLFHLVKRPRYYAAVDEIREPHNPNTHARAKNGAMSRDGQSLPTWGLDGTQSLRGVEKRYTEPSPLGKLPGSVWSIPSAPLTVPASLGVDHFAAYPPELCRRIILGWSPPGVCTACGEGRRPVVERERVETRKNNAGIRNVGTATAHLAWGIPGEWRTSGRTDATITGYACACPQPDAPTRPAVVVDPFAGTGTSMLTASVLGRIGIGIDRSGDYCRLAKWRCADPGERARALGVPKPPPVPDGQGSLFDDEAV